MSMSWQERHGEKATCVRCLEVREATSLDRLFWCEACRERGLRRAAAWGWLAGALVAGLLTLWIVVFVRPSRNLILGGWIATVVAAFWLAARIAREIGYGAMRVRNRRAVEAMPPADRPGEREA